MSNRMRERQSDSQGLVEVGFPELIHALFEFAQNMRRGEQKATARLGKTNASGGSMKKWCTDDLFQVLYLPGDSALSES